MFLFLSLSLSLSLFFVFLFVFSTGIVVSPCSFSSRSWWWVQRRPLSETAVSWT